MSVPQWVVVNIPVLIGRGLHLNRKEQRPPDGQSAFIGVPISELIATPRAVVDAELNYPTNISRRGHVLPVIRCPKCGTRAYSPGPSGLPQRKCRRCNWIWSPEENANPSPPPSPPTDDDPVLGDPTIKHALDVFDGKIVDVKAVKKPKRGRLI